MADLSPSAVLCHVYNWVVYLGDRPLEIPHDVMDAIIEQADTITDEAGTERFGLIGQRNEVDRERMRPGTEFSFRDNSPLAGLIAQVALDSGDKISAWVKMLGAVRRISVSPDAVGEIVGQPGARSADSGTSPI